MKTKLTDSAIIILLFTLLCFGTVQAEIPEKITFQGKLLTSDGTPFNGTKNMTFTIGEWTTQMNVPVINGLYSVELAVPDTAFDNADVKLNIKIDDTNLSPDTKFLSVPYAYRAMNSDKLDGKGGTYYIQTLSIDGDQLSISNGNTVTLPSGGGGGTVQDLEWNADTLKITENDNATPIDLIRYIQDLNLTNDTLKITKNDNATKIDLKPYKQTLALNGSDLSISDGNTVTLSTVEQDPKVGVLSQNFVPKWDTTNKTLQNSVIYTELGKVAIGITNNLMAKFHVEENQPGNALRSFANSTSGMGGEFAVTRQSNNDAALRAYTQGGGYGAWISINNISNSAPALFVSTTGTGPAGKFTANSTVTALDVQNDNASPTSYGIKSFSPGIAIAGTTNSGHGVDGIANSANGVGIYGYSSNGTGGLFQTGNITTFALKSDGKFWCTADTKIEGNTGMGGDPNGTYRLYVYGDAYATGVWQTSDETLKTNIEPIESSLNKIMQLNGVEYEWIDKQKFGKGQYIGFLAQDLMKVFPELVRYDGKNYAVQYAPLTAVLAEAMKELKMQNDELRSENKKLAGEIEKLKAMFVKIQSQLNK